MSYDSNKKPLELSALTTLASNDTIVVGDTSDTDEVVKTITVANLITYLQSVLETPFLSTISGIIDPENNQRTFTFSEVPQAIIADGVIYLENNGYTMSGLTATMDIPPSQYIKGFK